MLRNRNIYIEDFFGATAESVPAEPLTQPTTVTEIQSEPVNEISTEPSPEPTPEPIADPIKTDLSATISNPTVVNNYGTPMYNPYYYPVNFQPRPNPLYPDDYYTTSPNPTMGGGFGNGAGIDESIYMDEAGDTNILAPQELPNKKRVIWLIVIAVAVYLGYKYFKKK